MHGGTGLAIAVRRSHTAHFEVSKATPLTALMGHVQAITIIKQDIIATAVGHVGKARMKMPKWNLSVPR